PMWLDARPEALAQRLRRSPFVRPLVGGQNPAGALRDLAAARGRFYAAAIRVNAMMEIEAVVEAVETTVETAIDAAAATDADGASASGGAGTVLLRARTKIGHIVIGEAIAAAEIQSALEELGS